MAGACFSLTRSYDVRHPIQHGSHRLASQQNWRPGNRLQLRAAVHEDNDPCVQRCLGGAREWRVCPVSPFHGMPEASPVYVVLILHAFIARIPLLT